MVLRGIEVSWVAGGLLDLVKILIIRLIIEVFIVVNLITGYIKVSMV